ncbi:hypothetical protein [Priestia taiwanensis]|uniref:Uncharacterized protein n=1 Tax=Priestia taiwanensis TaxID=1347902 RepID=A0A917ELQ6_9BACI|nr:hypothetical protein [Priestia taiwanensis]MBM7362277.1 branched-subunit amino acid permease [Priestia taiwanensis]GGE60927.1 hypothetical protein GCM10007140_08990 [Priestia taiwanensis]
MSVFAASVLILTILYPITLVVVFFYYFIQALNEENSLPKNNINPYNPK